MPSKPVSWFYVLLQFRLSGEFSKTKGSHPLPKTDVFLYIALWVKSGNRANLKSLEHKSAKVGSRKFTQRGETEAKHKTMIQVWKAYDLLL